MLISITISIIIIQVEGSNGIPAGCVQKKAPDIVLAFNLRKFFPAAFHPTGPKKLFCTDLSGIWTGDEKQDCSSDKIVIQENSAAVV